MATDKARSLRTDKGIDDAYTKAASAATTIRPTLRAEGGIGNLADARAAAKTSLETSKRAAQPHSLLSALSSEDIATLLTIIMDHIDVQPSADKSEKCPTCDRVVTLCKETDGVMCKIVAATK